jgi:rhomboid protease GluP
VGVNDERCYSCGRRNPGLWGYAPLVRSLGSDLGFVRLIVGGSVAMYVISLVMSGPSALGGSALGFLAPRGEVLFLLGSSGALPVAVYGRWWTVLSASWLHGGILHILFNMMWVRQLAPATAELYGAGRLVVIYTVAGAAGFALSTVAGMGFALPLVRAGASSVGASAPIFGLLGALVCYGQRTGSRVVHSQAMGYAGILFVMGLIMPGVDNYAHAGGFAGGYLAARLLDPLKPERIDHLVMALVCLVATAAAIAASVVLGLGFFVR